MLTGWEFFKTYQALKLHFTSDQYDVVKYRGRISHNIDKFALRGDVGRFNYFGNKFNRREDAAFFCVANFVKDNSDFVYSSYDEANSVFLSWKKITESISKVFSDDLNAAVGLAKGANLFQITPQGNPPPLLQMVKAKVVNQETVVILEKELGSFFDDWKVFCENDPYMTKQLLVMRKYKPFLKYNRDKVSSIIRECGV